MRNFSFSGLESSPVPVQLLERSVFQVTCDKWFLMLPSACMGK